MKSETKYIVFIVVLIVGLAIYTYWPEKDVVPTVEYDTESGLDIIEPMPNPTPDDCETHLNGCKG